jgi:hypothetical protein
MRKIEIYAIDHVRPRGIRPIFGGISKQFICGYDDLHGVGISSFETYADMRAPYWIWKNRDDLDIIGFHGYRKFLDFQNLLRVPAWYEVGIGDFRVYQEWLAKYDGQYIQELLAQHDIIVAPTFNCAYNLDMEIDFRRSRSSHDWDVFMDLLPPNVRPYVARPYIRPMHFVTRASVFNRFMEWWWPLAEAIRVGIESKDATDPAYLHRPMAYLSERMYSLWLDSSGLSMVEVPLLQCWDVK